jgi:hypothetical protein
MGGNQIDGGWAQIYATATPQVAGLAPYLLNQLIM